MTGLELPQFWLSLVALAVIYVKIFKPQREESCRSDIRRIRDDLFDFMWKHGLDYSDPGYVHSRNLMNGMMRLTNCVGAFEFLFLMATAPAPPNNEYQSPIETVNDPVLREKLHRSINLAYRTFLTSLYTRGFFGLLFKGLLAVVNAVRRMRGYSTSVQRRATLLLGSLSHQLGTPVLTNRQKCSLS